MRTIIELASTDTTSGQAGLANIEPTLYLKSIVDAAQKRMLYLTAVEEHNIPKGNVAVVVPYRNEYLTSMEDTTTEGLVVAFTELSNLNGITLTPTIHAYGVSLSNKAMRVNWVNLVAAARKELTHYNGDVVDKAIRDALRGATDAAITTRGKQLLYGGDAYSTGTLEAGDVFTTDLIAEGRRRLMSTAMKYWSGASELTATTTKPAWFPTKEEPFLIFIGPEQEVALLKDSQFVNAAEYGSQEVLLNGEIGKYLGVKVVLTPNTTSSAVYGSGGATLGHEILLVKAKSCGAIAWGQRPKLHVFDYPSELETRMILEVDYQADSIHDSAIVLIYVTDE